MNQQQSSDPFAPQASKNEANNPYAPPQSLSSQLGHSSCWREKKILVVPRGGELPHRCIKCNEPAEMDKPKKYSWHHPGWYLLIPVGIIFYIIAGLIASKKAQFAIGLCEAHRSRRRAFRFAALGLFIVGLLSLFAVMSGVEEAWGAVSVFSLLLSGIVLVIGSTYLTATHITDAEARLRGCKPAFLDSLPGN
ncbi:MAG: hypothetical protein V4631_01185 [Pseudomonadota bacterium]